MSDFRHKLGDAIGRHSSHLVVGLDPTLEGLPQGIERSTDGILQFTRAIIAATADLVCAFKPQAAFYEALGPDGWRILAETVKSVPAHIPVIVDAKRGDIGNTAAAYARAMFDGLGADACTVNPYMGIDTLEPYVTHPRGFIFVLCRTTNPGAAWLQDIEIEGGFLYEKVARDLQSWTHSDRCGLVVASTDPVAAARVAEAAPGLLFLSPGLGPQGGDISCTMAALGSSAHSTLWNVSRAIVDAGKGVDFADAARTAALRYRDDINDGLTSVVHAS